MGSTRGNLSTNDVTTSTNDDSEVKKTIKFNVHGLAVGPGARNFNKRIGKLVETLVPIKFKGWHHVTDNYKEDVWNGLKVRFYIIDFHNVLFYCQLISQWLICSVNTTSQIM